ncbi:MAG: hypothetical protein M3044_00205 [Thermoproteota archaeon]|nr:hypothetical protein [Thermoproteota archaeon]
MKATFAEYPKDLIREINEQDGRVAILTDFDCAGIHIAEKVISEDIKSEHDEHKKKIATSDLVSNLPYAIADIDTAPRHSTFNRILCEVPHPPRVNKEAITIH